jgi:hypothetical protein
MTINYDMLPKTELDFTKISTFANRLEEIGKYSEAIKIYYCLCDGDSSLEAGYFAHRISTCYEKLGDNFAAKYWAGRAVEENPTIGQYTEQREKFSSVEILNLLDLHEIAGPIQS